MSKSLPNAGDYYARRNKAITVVQSKDGALGWEVSYSLTGDVQYEDVNTFYFGAKDGTLLQFAWNAMREVFPDWVNEDPFFLETIPLSETGEPEFILAKCYHDNSYTPEGKDEPIIQFKPRFINALNRSRTTTPLDAAGRKAVMTKWRSKFAAITKISKPASTKKEEKPAATPQAELPVAAAPAKSAAKGPPRSNATTATPREVTIEECWTKVVGAHPECKTDEQQQEILAPLWLAAIKKVDPNANNEDGNNFTLAQWGAVATELGV